MQLMLVVYSLKITQHQHQHFYVLIFLIHVGIITHKNISVLESRKLKF